jgi:hypothetical protein
MPSSTEKEGKPGAPVDDAVVEDAGAVVVVVLLGGVEAVASRCQGELVPVMPLIFMSILQTVVMLQCTPTSKSNANMQLDQPFDI